MTSLASIAVGQAVNIEVDLLARYVARLLEVGSQTAQAVQPDDSPVSGVDAGEAAWIDRLKRSGMM